MIPQFVLLETPPEFYYLEEMFERYRYPSKQAEKVLKDVLFLMRSKQNLNTELPRWIERFRHKESQVGELLYRPIEALGEGFHRQFTMWGMYLPDGQLPYAYSKQHRECTLFQYDMAYHCLKNRWQIENTEKR